MQSTCLSRGERNQIGEERNRVEGEMARESREGGKNKKLEIKREISMRG